MNNAHPLRAETTAELRKLMRDPAFVLPSFGFPLGFFVLFAVLLPFAKGEIAQLTMIANYGAFGTLAAAMFAAGLPLAMEKDAGVYALKRTTPLPTSLYLAAKLIAATLFALCVAAAVLVLGLLLLPVSISLLEGMYYFASCTLAAMSFATLGLLIGARFALNAAPMVINLVFMTLAFLGGLVLPLGLMPKMMQTFSLALPSFYMGELNRAAIGASPLSASATAIAIGVLLGIGLLAVLAARRVLARSSS
jgi:ABC-2 type transport system permease protein